jgi:hypothetical protein
MNAPINYYTRVLGEASATGLSKFRVSPLDYQEWTVGDEIDPTECMREGTMFHMAIHEPERFARSYVEIPVMALRSKQDKLDFLGAVFNATDVALEFDGEDAETLRSKVAREVAKTGVQVMTTENLATLRGMARSLNRPQHNEPRGIIARGKKELEFRWKDKVSGLQCKARLDSWDDELGILSDLKRTMGITRSAFRREILNRGYHFQLAFYRRALRETGADPRYCCFTCGSPTGPLHHWAVYDLPEETLDACDTRITEDLVRLAECVNKNDWPSINDGKATTIDIRPEYI